MEVEHLAVARQCLKPMGKAFGNQQRHVIVLCEHLAVPPQKSGGVFSDVHSDIKHLAAKASDELHFSVWSILEVHSAHGSTLFCERAIDLCDRLAVQELFKFLSTEHAF